MYLHFNPSRITHSNHNKTTNHKKATKFKTKPTQSPKKSVQYNARKLSWRVQNTVDCNNKAIK